MLSDPQENEDELNSEPSKLQKHLRQSSVSSLNSTTESLLGDSPMQVVEVQQAGPVELSLYKKYFSAGGGPCIIYLLVMLCTLTQIFASGGDYFLSYWVNHQALEESLYEANLDIFIFTGITVLTIIFTLSRSFLIFTLAMKSSTSLHNSMFKGISHAPMHFFNTNPTGRILNRFSKDLGQVDELLPTVMIGVITIFLSMAGTLAVVAMVNPIFLAPTAVLAVIFYFLRIFYLRTSMDLKRIEAISKNTLIISSLNFVLFFCCSTVTDLLSFKCFIERVVYNPIL